MFAQDLKDLEMKLEIAGVWGTALLKELGPAVGSDRDTSALADPGPASGSPG